MIFHFTCSIRFTIITIFKFLIPFLRILTRWRCINYFFVLQVAHAFSDSSVLGLTRFSCLCFPSEYTCVCLCGVVFQPYHCLPFLLFHSLLEWLINQVPQLVTFYPVRLICNSVRPSTLRKRMKVSRGRDIWLRCGPSFQSRVSNVSDYSIQCVPDLLW